MRRFWVIQMCKGIFGYLALKVMARNICLTESNESAFNFGAKVCVLRNPMCCLKILVCFGSGLCYPNSSQRVSIGFSHPAETHVSWALHDTWYATSKGRVRTQTCTLYLSHRRPFRHWLTMCGSGARPLFCRFRVSSIGPCHERRLRIVSVIWQCRLRYLYGRILCSCPQCWLLAPVINLRLCVGWALDCRSSELHTWNLWFMMFRLSVPPMILRAILVGTTCVLSELCSCRPQSMSTHGMLWNIAFSICCTSVYTYTLVHPSACLYLWRSHTVRVNKLLHPLHEPMDMFRDIDAHLHVYQFRKSCDAPHHFWGLRKTRLGRVGVFFLTLN